MPELVINVSNIMSPLCYSLIRIEPYTTCSHRCVYCYARWYYTTENNIVRVRPRAIAMFAQLARKIYRKGLKPIPARLSTLVDPFQPHEELYKASLKVLSIAYDYRYPLIVNTKGYVLAKDPWRKILVKMAEEGLVVLQISISTVIDSYAKILEPVAPSPSARLKIAKMFSELGVPIVVRLSPYIPKISILPSVEELVAILREAGVRHVIVEVIRLEKERFFEFMKMFGLDVEAEGYSLREVEGGKPLLKPSLRSRIEEYLKLRDALEKSHIAFATCKEGLFELHTAPDCCGIYMLKDVVRRPTLYEIYCIAMERGGIRFDELDQVFENICRGHDYVCGRDLDEYPKQISKHLRYHEKRLLRILKNFDLLSKICPCLAVEDSWLRVKKLDQLFTEL